MSSQAEKNRNSRNMLRCVKPCKARERDLKYERIRFRTALLLLQNSMSFMLAVNLGFTSIFSFR